MKSFSYKSVISVTFILFWIVGGILAGAMWMGPHMFPMQASSDWGSLNFDQTLGTWQMSHVLGDSCDCSKSILNHLMTRAKSEVRETVIWVTRESSQADFPELNQLKAKGFLTQVLDDSASVFLEALAVPTLLIHDPKGQLVYAGGYSRSKDYSKEHVLDLEIFESFKQGRNYPGLPIYGCVTSKKYEAFFNSNLLKMRK